jgi:hypothetical protein
MQHQKDTPSCSPVTVFIITISWCYPFSAPASATISENCHWPTRVSAAEQLLVALKALHDVGLVHRRTPHQQSLSRFSSSVSDQILIQSADINEGALMWEMASISEHDTASRYKWFGRPKKMLQYETIWTRGEVVQPITIPYQRTSTLPLLRP